MREAPSVAERPLSQTGNNVEEHFQNLNIFVTILGIGSENSFALVKILHPILSLRKKINK